MPELGVDFVDTLALEHAKARHHSGMALPESHITHRSYLCNPVCLATKNAGSLYKSPFILRFT